MVHHPPSLEPIPVHRRMTLTVVVGSSGSGKTTFLNDVHTLNKCTYVRQYHNLRPYVPVSKIPNFDPTKLPFWNLYSDEKSDSYNPNILVGGTMAGEFTAGLSGGQRKLLLFELVKQRTCKDVSNIHVYLFSSQLTTLRPHRQ